eukprot:TRINITY_DN225_c0_g1_i1.p1 TRINITY_DN225_c0_g1~~TRINITY_DN225_c0_g1_i1.p1  ORF type:complete len:682 (-),score=104.29 TRINITY_DN225_c0_g1_i1:322-2190(-)
MSTLTPDGYWKDLNYTDDNLQPWSPYEHCSRLHDMVQAYKSPKTSLYGDKTLFSLMINALNWWIQKNLIAKNWWYNEIGCPSNLGQLALLIEDELSNTQTVSLTTIMYRADWNSKITDTGENLMDIALIHVYNGILNSNESYVKEAFTKLYSVINWGGYPPQGIQHDGVFLQHGPQLYNGPSYGESFAVHVMNLFGFTQNTSFYPTADRQVVVDTFLLDGSQWMIRYPAALWDFSAVGRQISYPYSEEPPIGGANYCALDPNQIATMGTTRHDEYQVFAQRLQHTGPPLKGNKFFESATYMVQHTENFFASVRMAGNGVHGDECINNQGLKSTHLADGCNYIYHTGAEYQDIFPTWDWELIPGTTVEHNGVPLDCEHVNFQGQDVMVSGVSDGTYGFNAMNWTAPRVFGRSKVNQTLTAKKAWFWFNDHYLALGTDISTESNADVFTTLDQRLLNGDVYVSSQSSPLASGVHSYSSLEWLYHDNIGYVFPAGAFKSLTVMNREQSGDWSSIGTFQGNVTKQVFTAYISHAPPVRQDTYSYLVFPYISLDDLKNQGVLTLNDIKIAQNDEKVQSILYEKLGLFQGVFYEVSTLNIGFFCYICLSLSVKIYTQPYPFFSLWMEY